MKSIEPETQPLALPAPDQATEDTPLSFASITRYFLMMTSMLMISMIYRSYPTRKDSPGSWC